MFFGKVGRAGHGKTMRATVDAIELARLRGAVLAANIRIKPPSRYKLEVVALPMDGFSEALAELIDELHRCDVCTKLDAHWLEPEHGEPGCMRRGVVVLVDEIDTIWDARDWDKVTKADRFTMKQHRKFGVDVIWTAQFVDQVEKSIRNVTEDVELMRAIPQPTIHRREQGKRPWLLVGQTFRPGAVRELTQKVDPDQRLGRRIYRYRREHEAWYRTDDLVVPPERAARRRGGEAGSPWLRELQRSRQPMPEGTEYVLEKVGPNGSRVRSA